MRWTDNATAPRIPTRLTDEAIRQVCRPRRRWRPAKLFWNLVMAILALVAVGLFVLPWVCYFAGGG